MRRAVTVLFVLVASFGIVHGDLLRPCQCGPDNPLSCGLCEASRAVAARSAPRCRCCCEESDPAQPEPAQAPSSGFGICPGPRAPSDLPEVPVDLPAPAVSGLAHLAPTWLVPVGPADTAEEATALPAEPPWRISPEGLTVFLT